MRRPFLLRLSLAAWVALGPVILGAGSPPEPVRPEFSQGELEALRREVERPSETEDPFEGGPAPDLVVLTSTNVHGETVPCG